MFPFIWGALFDGVKALFLGAHNTLSPLKYSGAVYIDFCSSYNCFFFFVKQAPKHWGVMGDRKAAVHAAENSMV